MWSRSYRELVGHLQGNAAQVRESNSGAAVSGSISLANSGIETTTALCQPFLPQPISLDVLMAEAKRRISVSLFADSSSIDNHDGRN